MVILLVSMNAGLFTLPRSCFVQQGNAKSAYGLDALKRIFACGVSGGPLLAQPGRTGELIGAGLGAAMRATAAG